MGPYVAMSRNDGVKRWRDELGYEWSLRIEHLAFYAETRQEVDAAYEHHYPPERTQVRHRRGNRSH